MMNEEKVVRDIVSGDTAAFRELVERYQTGLIIHCENIVKDRQDGEDIAQEAFVKAYTQLHKFNPEKARFSTWLYRIATNLSIDYLRKHRKSMALHDIDSVVQEADPSQFEESEILHIRSLVETLEPPKYAAVIKAFFWEGKSYKEIARDYDTSTGTIGTWMNRAKLQLKEKLS